MMSYFNNLFRVYKKVINREGNFTPEEKKVIKEIKKIKKEKNKKGGSQ